MSAPLLLTEAFGRRAPVSGAAPVVQPTGERLLVRTTKLALFCVGSADVIGGALRFALARAGVPWMSYFPTLLALGVTVLYFAYLGVVSRYTPQLALLIAFFAFYAIYSVLTGVANRVGQASLVGQIGRVAFALYTWTPFFLGMAIAHQRQEETFVRYAGIWWAVAVGGVLVNRVVSFPWVGSSFEILGQQSELARQWSTNGIDRLSGFSRASFAAANQTMLFGIALMAGRRTPALFRVPIWVISCVAVAFTTSKTPLLAILLVPVMLAGLVLFQRGRASAGGFWPAISVLLVLATLMIVLPISSGTAAMISNHNINDYSFVTTSSLLDRALNMWPEAFALIARDHAPYQWLFGRGLGGIGSAQGIFEPLATNAADNLFVFLYVTFGLGCVCLLLPMLARFRGYFTVDPPAFRLLFGIAAGVLILGIASNVLESVVPAIALGMLVGKGTMGAAA